LARGGVWGEAQVQGAKRPVEPSFAWLEVGSGAKPQVQGAKRPVEPSFAWLEVGSGAKPQVQ